MRARNDIERNPVVWFVTYQEDCMIGLAQNNNVEEIEQEIRGETENTLETVVIEEYQTKIYPNPFDNFFDVESGVEDEVIVQDANGVIVLKQHIKSGFTKIDTKSLSLGLYIVKLMRQGVQTKLVKL